MDATSALHRPRAFANLAPVKTAAFATHNVVKREAERAVALASYYTVRERWVTGLPIVNTSKRIQAVKLRFRRAMDALDFNLALLPRGNPHTQATEQDNLTRRVILCPLKNG